MASGVGTCSESSDDDSDCYIEALDVDRLVSQADLEVTVPVGEYEFTVTQHPQLRCTGIQDCSDSLTESTSTTGAVLWDGAVVAARFVAHNHSMLFREAAPAQQRCVELGCGVGGLTGLTLAKLGP